MVAIGYWLLTVEVDYLLLWAAKMQAGRRFHASRAMVLRIIDHDTMLTTIGFSASLPPSPRPFSYLTFFFLAHLLSESIEVP